MRLRAQRTFMLVVTLAGLLAAACARGPAEEFPSFVYAASSSLEAYRAAASVPAEVTTHIPCYCGCATSQAPHRHLRDCFYKPEGGYTDHAAGCDLCGKIMADVKTEFEQGKDVKTIRADIDAKYAAYGAPTDTPIE